MSRQDKGWMAGMKPAPPQPYPCACPVPGALWEEGDAVAGFPLYQKRREEGSQLCARVVPASGTVCSHLPAEMNLCGMSLGMPAPTFRFESF